MIFISHSSHDKPKPWRRATGLRRKAGTKWFWTSIHPAASPPGQRWREELRKAGERCSPVIVLLLRPWATAYWCLTEFLFADELGKKIFPVLTAPCSHSDLPGELTGKYQIAEMSTPETRAPGLEGLRVGLQRAGLHPRAFPWPPKGETSARFPRPGSDSFDLLLGDPLLSGIPRQPFDLPRLPPAAFKEIIQGPTRLRDVGIEIRSRPHRGSHSGLRRRRRAATACLYAGTSNHG